MQANISLSSPDQQLENGEASPEHHADPLHGLDVAIESVLAVDLRLIYGILVPILLVIGLMIPLILAPSYWLVAAALVPELAILAFILTKIMAMLNEDADPEYEPEPPR